MICFSERSLYFSKSNSSPITRVRCSRPHNLMYESYQAEMPKTRPIAGRNQIARKDGNCSSKRAIVCALSGQKSLLRLWPRIRDASYQHRKRRDARGGIRSLVANTRRAGSTAAAEARSLRACSTPARSRSQFPSRRAVRCSLPIRQSIFEAAHRSRRWVRSFSDKNWALT